MHHRPVVVLLESFRATGRLLMRLAPDPVSRSVDEARTLASATAWSLWGWMALAMTLTAPRIEYRMVPLLWRTGGSARELIQAWHGLAHALGFLAAARLALFLIRREHRPHSGVATPFLAALATGPVWLVLFLGSLIYRWDTRPPWEFGGLAACVSLFCLYAVFTRAWGMSDRRATLLVPLLMGTGIALGRMLIRATA